MKLFIQKKHICIIIFLLFFSHAEARVFKIATISPNGSSWMKEMKKGAGSVEKETDGRVKFKFYPGGVMGDDKIVLKKMRIGQLHGGAITSGSLASRYPDCQVYGIPLKFKSNDEVDYVRSKMDSVLLDGFRKNGFEIIGIAEGGFAYIMSNKPVRSLTDIKTCKVWVPDTDQSIIEAVKAFDVSPIPLTLADVRTGLQTGLIDTVGTSPIGAITLQWHTQVKHLTNMPILYIYAVFTLNNKSFSKISPEDQVIIKKHMGASFSRIDKQNRVDNVKAFDALKNVGIQIDEISPDEYDAWKEKAKTAESRMVSNGGLSADIVEQLNTHLKNFRAGQ